MAFQIGNQKPKDIKTEKQKDQKTGPATAAPKPKEVKAAPELEFGYWWLSHRQTVKQLATVTAIIIAGAFLIYGIYGLLDHYLISYSANRQLYAPRTVSLNWDYINQVSTPQNILVEDVKVIRAGENYDLYTTVTNPNEKWYVEELMYHFDFGGASLDSETSYVLPGETIYLVSLDEERTGSLSADLVIDDLKWKKVPDYNELKEQLLQFEVSDILFLPARQTGIEGENPISQVKFTIENKSPQNFWNIDIVIMLYSGQNLRAINTYNLRSLDALEEREVVINWPGSLPAINRVAILPQVDILNPDSYKGFGEVIGEQK